MDFELTPLQRAIAGSLDAVLERHLGLARARAVIESRSYDQDLEDALRQAGLMDLFRGGDEVGPLDAALAVERISSALGSVATTAHLLVGPALGIDLGPGAVCLVRAGTQHPARYAAHARTMIEVGADACAVLSAAEPGVEALPSVYGYPLAVPAPGPVLHRIAPGSARTATDWWRVGLAAEAVGLMRSALDTAVQYALDRTVFNRALGSFQALQHRLAECTVAVEGSRWLVYEAAGNGGSEAAAAAAAHTVGSLSRLTRETHQIMGAIGLTSEHDLHLWTFRMQALRTELGGVREHREAVVETRWTGPAATVSGTVGGQ